MAETGMHINWGAKGTADAVAAARMAMQSGGRPVHKPAKQERAAAAVAAAPVQAAPAQKSFKLKKLKALGGAAGMPSLYALSTLLIMGLSLAGVWKANVAFAPEMYGPDGMVPVASAHASGKNYAVFDLNLNIRRWKEELVQRLDYTPDVVVIGASQWQEAHSSLVRSERMFNGHIHRDYWEDLLGAVEVLVRNNRLPKRMIIAIRDKQFTPVELRKDFLWEPGIPNYRKMADRLGIEKESPWKTYAWQRMKERLSLTMLFNNVTRWYNAEERPHATADLHFQHLDTLLPDGSILWSGDHKAIFTAERTRKEALALADTALKTPLSIDPLGVKSYDAVLGFLKAKGVQVVLVHPPYNPIFYDAVKNTRFVTSLDKVRKVTRGLADKYGFHVIGDFDPSKVGCTADEYIDAEHSSPACLQKIFDQYDALVPELRREALASKNKT